MSPDDLPFTPARETPEPEATVFRCPLCAARFTHAEQACPTCPLNVGCTLVTCPNCDYAFPRSSRVVGWFRRLSAAVRRNGTHADGPEGT